MTTWQLAGLTDGPPGAKKRASRFDSLLFLEYPLSVKTTLDISDSLHARAKQLAAKLGIPLTRLVEGAIEEKLNRPVGSGTAAKRFRVKAFHLGMKPAYLGMNLNHLASEIEDAAILGRIRKPSRTKTAR